MFTLGKPLVGVQFYENIFSVLFYKSPQESVDFLEKWMSALSKPIGEMRFGKKNIFYSEILFILLMRSPEFLYRLWRGLK